MVGDMRIGLGLRIHKTVRGARRNKQLRSRPERQGLRFCFDRSGPFDNQHQLTVITKTRRSLQRESTPMGEADVRMNGAVLQQLDKWEQEKPSFP